MENIAFTNSMHPNAYANAFSEHAKNVALTRSNNKSVQDFFTSQTSSIKRICTVHAARKDFKYSQIENESLRLLPNSATLSNALMAEVRLILRESHTTAKNSIQRETAVEALPFDALANPLLKAPFVFKDSINQFIINVSQAKNAGVIEKNLTELGADCVKKKKVHKKYRLNGRTTILSKHGDSGVVGNFTRDAIISQILSENWRDIFNSTQNQNEIKRLRLIN
jgi:hypothetical protein